MTRFILMSGALLACAALPGCFLNGRGQANATARAMQVTAAQPKMPKDRAFEFSAAERDAFIGEQIEGYVPVGDPVEQDLSTFKPWALSLERGRCYRMVMRLDPNARFSEHARGGVSFVYGGRGTEINAGPGVHGPGAVASAGCPLASAKVEFDMRAYLGSAGDKAKLHDLGQGPFTAQLYARPASDTELAQLAADSAKQSAEIAAHKRAEAEKAAARRQKQAEGCSLCPIQRIHCLDSGSWTCAVEYSACLMHYEAESFDSPCRR